MLTPLQPRLTDITRVNRTTRGLAPPDSMLLPCWRISDATSSPTCCDPRPTRAGWDLKEVRYEIGHFADADVMTDYLLFINALLPGVRYVINVRDPQAALPRSGWWREHPDAVTALGRSVEHLREAAGTLADVLGPGRVALTEYEQWSADPSIGVSALKSIGFPVQEALIRESLSTHLEHGQNSERP